MGGGGEGRRAREIVKSGYLWILSILDKRVNQCILLTGKL